VLSTLNLTCNTPAGNGAWSITPGCAIDLDLPDTPNAEGTTASVHDGTVDTGTAIGYGPVAGQASVANQCLTLTALAGLCTATATGTVGATLDEAVKTVGGVNYQELTLDGRGLAFTSQVGCLGLMSGAVKLNDIKFDVQVTGGTTTGIDFRQTP